MPSDNICSQVSYVCLIMRLIQNQSEWSNSYYGCLVQIILFASWRFQSVILCRNLMTVHAKWMSHALPQRIRTIKYFTVQKVLLVIQLSQKSTKSSVQKCWDHCDKRQTISYILKVPSMNYPHFAKRFQIFCCKIEIVEKIKWHFASRCGRHYIGIKIYEKQQFLLCSNW